MIDQAMVDRLRGAATRGPNVLSVYLNLPADPAGHRGVPARLEDSFHRAGIDDRTMPALRPDLEAIRDGARHLHDTLRGAMAWFSSTELGLFEQVRLPCRVTEYAVAGRRPYLRPLLAARQRCPRYCAVVTDQQHSTLVIASADGLWESDRLTSPGLRKPNFAGWYGLAEHTVRNRAEELIRRHRRLTMQAVEHALTRKSCGALVVGGAQHGVSEFVAMLPAGVRGRLAGTFVTDPHTASPAEVRRDADKVVERWSREQEMRLLEEIRADLGTAGSRSVAGLKPCLEAVNEHAVEVLAMRADDFAPGYVCDTCRLIAVDEGTCAVCGAPGRPVPDVYEEMAVAVLDAGGQVEQVDVAEQPHNDPVARLRLRKPAPP